MGHGKGKGIVVTTMMTTAVVTATGMLATAVAPAQDQFSTVRFQKTVMMKPSRRPRECQSRPEVNFPGCVSR